MMGDVLEFVQDVIQAEGDLQHLNMAEGHAPLYPDESDEEGISNTVDGSSQVTLLYQVELNKCIFGFY